MNETAVAQLTCLPCEPADTFDLSLGRHIVTGDRLHMPRGARASIVPVGSRLLISYPDEYTECKTLARSTARLGKFM